MTERLADITYSFDRPGIYEIHVLGTVNRAVFRHLNGLQRNWSVQADVPDADVTIWTGWLPDQAALNGLLNTLYDHGLTLALVRQVEYQASFELT